MITLDEGSVGLVWDALNFRQWLEENIYVKKIPSMKVTDIIKSKYQGATFELIGIRAGGKFQVLAYDLRQMMEHLHTNMINIINLTIYTYVGMKMKKRIKNGIKVFENFSYSSENNLSK